MKNFKFKTISTILALVLASAIGLSSCADRGGETVSSETESNSESESTVTVTDADSIKLFGDGMCVNVIFSEASRLYASSIGRAIFNVYGDFPEMLKDGEHSADSSVFEILIGDTDRAESDYEVSAEVNDAHYFVGISGNKLVINANSDYMLECAVEYFVSECLSMSEGSSFTFTKEMNKLCVEKDFLDSRWSLDRIPAYLGASASYVRNAYDAGGLTSERGKADEGSARVHKVQNTTVDELEAYVTRLVSVGFTETGREVIDSNVYVTLEREGERVYTYYLGYNKSVTVIYETVGASVEEVSTTVTAGANEGAVIYQYGLNMAPSSVEGSGMTGYVNCGMLYIIKLADNSLIIIDGGSVEQMAGLSAEDAPHDDLNAFLHEITGVGENEKITVACWLVTHAHGDHANGFPTFISKHASEYDVKSVCANIPAFETANASALKMKTLFTSYPDCKEVKLHTGQKLTFGDVTMQVLFTHEDTLNPAGNSSLVGGDFNGTSTVVKITAGEMSMLVLGDATSVNESFLVSAYSDATLKCDILQVAHHGFNDLPTLYEKVDASYALIPQSYGYFMAPPSNAESTHKAGISGIKQSLAGLIADGKVYFAGNKTKTVGFAYRDGSITVIQ